MDYLTFLTANTLIILSLCGIVYLIKQGACLVHWIKGYLEKSWKKIRGKVRDIRQNP